MWTILITIIIIVAIIILITVLSPSFFNEDWHYVPATFLICVVFLASWLVPLIIGMEQMETIQKQVESHIDIVSIKDNTITEGKISGGLFIIGGYIQQNPVYFYYKQVGSGYTQDYIPAKNAIIYEDTELNIGYIKGTTTWKEIDPEWEDKYLHWLIFLRPSPVEQTKYEIHIPQGSIVKEFVLDAE